jgi:hypothetical protein
MQFRSVYARKRGDWQDYVDDEHEILLKGGQCISSGPNYFERRKGQGVLAGIALRRQKSKCRRDRVLHMILSNSPDSESARARYAISSIVRA